MQLGLNETDSLSYQFNSDLFNFRTQYLYTKVRAKPSVE